MRIGRNSPILIIKIIQSREPTYQHLPLCSKKPLIKTLYKLFSCVNKVKYTLPRLKKNFQNTGQTMNNNKNNNAIKIFKF